MTKLAAQFFLSKIKKKTKQELESEWVHKAWCARQRMPDFGVLLFPCFRQACVFYRWPSIISSFIIRNTLTDKEFQKRRRSVCAASGLPESEKWLWFFHPQTKDVTCLKEDFLSAFCWLSSGAAEMFPLCLLARSQRLQFWADRKLGHCLHFRFPWDLGQTTSCKQRTDVSLSLLSLVAQGSKRKATAEQCNMPYLSPRRYFVLICEERLLALWTMLVSFTSAWVVDDQVIVSQDLRSISLLVLNHVFALLTSSLKYSGMKNQMDTCVRSSCASWLKKLGFLLKNKTRQKLLPFWAHIPEGAEISVGVVAVQMGREVDEVQSPRVSAAAWRSGRWPDDGISGAVYHLGGKELKIFAPRNDWPVNVQ